MKEIYEVMRKYGQMVMSQEYPVKNAKFMLETEEGVFATRDGADFNDLKEDDIELLGIKKIPYSKGGDMKAILYSSTPYCSKCIEEGRNIAATLDDMAQVVGPSVWVVDGRRSNEDRSKHLVKALKRSVGCMVFLGYDKKKKPVGYTVTLGRTLYEAVVAMTVLEKNAEITFLADKIGGGKALPKWEARLMRKIYKKKYSKAESKVKSSEVK